MAQETISAIQLIRSENVGPRTFYSLLRKFGSVEEALEYVGNKACPRAKAEAEIAEAEKLGIKILLHSDVEYPKILAETYDAPPVLFYKGNLELLKRDAIAFVGTRNSSANGCAITRKLAAEIGEAGFTVISGLARGIDTEAHKTSLATGTIAVMAGGLEEVYPPENKKLFEQIAEKGLLLGENPVGTKPMQRHFPQRNRIVAGLCLGVVVVEAAKKSGSMITAEFAVREGREVFAVPGSPLDPRCSGTNYLIKSGAVLTETADDIISNLGRERPQMKLLETVEEYEFEQEVVVVDESVRERIISKLSTSPIGVDEIAQQTALPVAVVNEILLELEINGKLQRQYGNKVALAA